MAFAQLTYRESLRDIEACLRAQNNKLYSYGHPQQGFPAAPWRKPTRCGTGASMQICPSSDRHCQKALPEGAVAVEPRTSCVSWMPLDRSSRCACVSLSMGHASGQQRGPSDSTAAGPSRAYPELHPHLRRETPRGQCSGFDPTGKPALSTLWIEATRIFPDSMPLPKPPLLRDPSQGPFSSAAGFILIQWTNPPGLCAINRFC